MGQFEEYVNAITEVSGKDYRACRDFNSKRLNEFKGALKKGSEADIDEMKKIIFVCVKNGTRSLLAFALAIVESRKIFKWKEHADLVEEIIDNVIEYGKQSDPQGEKDYDGLLEKMVTILKANELQKNVDRLYALIILAFEEPDNSLIDANRHAAKHFPWGQKTEGTLEFMDKSFEVMQGNPERRADDKMARFITGTFVFIYRDCMSNKKQALKYKDHVAKIFNWAKDQEWIDEDDTDKRTITYQWLKDCLEDYLWRYRDTKEIIEPVFKSCQELWECDEETLRKDTDHLMTKMSGSLMAELSDDATDKLVERVLSGEDPKVIMRFDSMYKSNPDKLNPHLEAIAENMEDCDDWVLSKTISFFRTVCEEHPEAMTPKCVKHLVNTLLVEETSGIAMMGLLPLAEKHPELLAPHDDAIINNMLINQSQASQASKILVYLAGYTPKKTAKYLSALKEAIKNCDSSMYMISLVHNMKPLGNNDPDEFAKYKDFFEEMKNDAQLKDYAIFALDAIAGRSLETVTQDVTEVQQDIIVLDERVTNTEENVSNLGKEVDETKTKVVVLAGEVNEQGQRLEELEDIVEETVQKVDEIDKKTLSHAPVWSRDVSKLLNPPTEHDWRLLAGRLGYTNDDIRNWATQADPCMSMFDEWFATNKTREATHAILKHLEEMDRMDAFLILENALKQTEDVIEEEEVEYATPPPVFISYQWSLQDEVKLLRNHLEMAGFECWMDIGQMGGGDKLFEKIDTGIRAAKVIICCVSEKYAKSPNCNREVNLSVNLGKLIIPLLMEKMSWPPKGSMGPIFGEYLFIRFFSRSGEECGDNRYWPLPKFQELLMQIRYNVVPIAELIKEPYLNWMSPPDEIIVIKSKQNKESEKAVVSKTSTDSEEEQSPDVFISYQWGKQPQIKALYNKLSGLGHTCWLDILQMGGGDSLYDKIDKGIRGCKVVLTCVTSKYALSANCRREVSLADALKKPVIPLLLEKMTWPPEGPMSMVFTQLLYINFHSPDVSIQHTWECPQLDELIAKICIHLPQIEHAGPMVQHSENDTKAVVENSPESKELKTKKNEVQKTDHAVVAPSVKDTSGENLETEATPMVITNTQPKEEKQDKIVQNHTDNIELKETTVVSENLKHNDEKPEESIHNQKSESNDVCDSIESEQVTKKSTSCHII